MHFFIISWQLASQWKISGNNNPLNGPLSMMTRVYLYHTNINSFTPCFVIIVHFKINVWTSFDESRT